MRKMMVSLLWLVAVPLALVADAPVLQAWSGDFPVAKLDLLPEGQRENGQGFFDDPKAFALFWAVFQPKEPVPEVDFENHLVVFTRNITFYNRTRIGSLKLVEEGVLEIIAMETLSAMHIGDKVAMALAVTPRKGVRFIRSGDQLVPVEPSVEE